MLTGLKPNETIDGAVLDGRGRVQDNSAAAPRAQGRRSIVAKAFLLITATAVQAKAESGWITASTSKHQMVVNRQLQE